VARTIDLHFVLLREREDEPKPGPIEQARLDGFMQWQQRHEIAIMRKRRLIRPNDL